MRRLRSLLGRSTAAILERGWRLGLARPRQGFETIAQAAVRVGFSRSTLKSLLERQQVPFRRTYSNQLSGKAQHARLYDPEAINAAVRKHLEPESISSGARRHGVAVTTLWAWLESAGVIRPTPGVRTRWRLDSAVIDGVVLFHRNKQQRAA